MEAERNAEPTGSYAIYAEFEDWRADEDAEFKAGLDSIINSPQGLAIPEDERVVLINRAKAFYFSRRKGVAVTWEGYLAYKSEKTSTETDSTLNAEAHHIADAESKATAPLSFAKISELIAAGKLDQIPYNRVIPEGLSEDRPSEPSAAVPRKPWEKP